MNRIIKYAILAYTFFSGIIATAFAIYYFVISMSSIALMTTISLEGITAIHSIASANLTPAQQSYYLNTLENFYAIGEKVEQKSLASLSNDQFTEYELLFILPPAILLGLIYYDSKKENKNE
jgi:flagellar motor component MotA